MPVGIGYKKPKARAGKRIAKALPKQATVKVGRKATPTRRRRSR